LVDWSSSVPLLVVCTARPELLERRPGWGGGKPNALTLSISPLSDEETARLLAELLERAVLPAEVQASLLARAGGNPLYAEQFARLLAEGGTDERLPLPENVQGIIAARLDGLPPEEKALLQDGAVLGKVFWLGAACAVGGLGREEGERRLHALERKEFVRRERRSSVGGEDEYAFRHVLVRDVAYGQIPRGARAEQHQRAAEWIEALGRPEDHAEMLAHHYLEALRLGQAAGREDPKLAEQARASARVAGERAYALGALPAARRFYESALELWPADDPQRPDLLLAYARSRTDDVFLDDAVLEGAAEGFLRAENPEGAAEAQARMGSIWLNRGDRDRALEHFEHARGLVDGRKGSAAKAFVLQELARTRMMGNEFDTAIPLATESLALAEALGLEGTRARNLNTIGVSRVVMGDRGGLEDLERAEEIARAINSYEEVGAAANLAWMNVLLGDLREATVLQQRAQRLAEQRGVPSFVRWQEVEHVFHCYWDGRWDEGLSTADGYLKAVEGPTHYMEPNCRSIRAVIWLARGRPEAALEDVQRATELARAAKDPQTMSPVLAIAGRVRLAVGDRGGASAAADELAEIWRSSGIGQPHECAEAPWVFRELGRESELAEALARERAKTRWHEVARLTVVGDFAGLAEHYAVMGSLPDEAHARLRAAEELVREGERAEADRQLALALPVFAQVGAKVWAAEARALLSESA
ncbi:MAG TPA: hypothetical protein VGF25_13985, partial [Thermoleophilaceae bacterium]